MNARIEEFAFFHNHQMDSGDIDPTYPAYAAFVSDCDPEQAAWLVLCHVTWYDVGSAIQAWHMTGGYPETGSTEVLSSIRTTGTERRAHRDVRQLRAHLAALLGAVSDTGPSAWLSAEDWPTLFARVIAVHGNGRWAAYKTCEMAQKVLGVPIVAPDAAHAASSGPRKGLGLLYGDLPPDNSAGSIHYLDAVTSMLADTIGEPDLAAVETSLCDYHSMTHGAYYVGHDIDLHLEQTLRLPARDRTEMLWAREASFPPNYRGEASGWRGVDRARKGAWVRSGEVLVR